MAEHGKSFLVLELVPTGNSNQEDGASNCPSVFRVISVQINSSRDAELLVAIDSSVAPPAIGECARQFLPYSLVNHLRSGSDWQSLAEMRNLVVLFVHKTSTNDVSDWFDEVYEVMRCFLCPITQIIEDDKGIHVVAAMNLFVSRTDAADSAIEMGRHLLETVDCRIGIASGTCFCGTVGGEESWRWDITGACVVRACRLMQLANTFPPCSPITAVVDGSVVSQMSNPGALRKFSEVLLKGSKDPVPVYAICVADYTIVSSVCSINAMDAGPEVRAKERRIMREKLIDQKNIVCGCATVVGGCLMGKKYTVLTALIDTPFSPIMHRCETRHGKCTIAKTIIEWFSVPHWSPFIQKLANEAGQAYYLKQFSHVVVKLELLFEHLIESLYHIAFIVDSAQHLDDTSLRFMGSIIAKLQTKYSHMSSPSNATHHGRWLWFLCVTPVLAGVSIQKIESMVSIELSKHVGRRMQGCFS